MNLKPSELDGSHDFDFLFGLWHIRNQFLRERLQGSDAWISFEATGECKPVLGGLGNVDEFRTDYGSGFIGMSLRLYDPQTRQWSIYWVDTLSHILQPPVSGSFLEGVGLFEGDDDYRGTPIQVRFTWSGITKTSARWEQTFSADHGETWETNWIMEFTRLEDA